MFKTLPGLTDNAFWRAQHQKKSFWCGTIRAVLRYIRRLLAVYVSLLANIGVLYQISTLISRRF
jgi:hypothetical protein